MTLDGTIIEANRLSIEFAGFRREDVIGRKFWVLTLGDILCHAKHPLGISIVVIYDFGADLQPDDLTGFGIDHTVRQSMQIALVFYRALKCLSDAFHILLRTQRPQGFKFVFRQQPS